MKKWQWWKNKWIRILMLTELVVLVILGARALTRDNQTYWFDASIFNRDDAGNALAEAIELPMGIYRVSLEYACDSDMAHFCIVEAQDGSSGVLCSGEHLNQGLGKTDFDLWITQPNTSVKVNISYGGGQMDLHGISMIQTDRDLYKAMFLTVVAGIVVDALAGLYFCHKERKGTDLLIYAGLSAVILVASIPLGNSHIYAGSDITYHLLRLGNIKDGFLSGQFPVRLDPTWLFGNGYASSICYGEIFLYFPAFLRMIGFTLQESWMWFLFVLNVAVCLVSYYSFGQIFKDKVLGFVCSAVYTLSIYRLYKEYSWSAIGEVQAFVFLPLILYAVFGIYTQTIKGVKKPYWLILALGMSGLIQCHVLTCELVVCFLSLTCIVLLRKTLHKRVIVAFLKAIGAVCLLNAWFVVPFLDYMINMDMVIHHVSARTIQENGLLLAQLFFGFFHRGVGRDIVNNGLIDVEALGVGITMMVGLAVFLYLWCFTRKTGTDKLSAADTQYDEERQHTVNVINAGKITAIWGVLAMLMSLRIFPWTKIQFMNRITQSLVSSIQYPNRFLMMATLFLTMTGAAAVVWMKARNLKLQGILYQSALVSIAVLTAVFYLDSVVAQAGELILYDEKGMGTGYLSGAEYLPYGTESSALTYHDPIPGENITVTNNRKEYLDVTFACSNAGDSDSYVDLALLGYKGYVAKTEDNGRLEITDGHNHCVRVVVPAGFDGEIHVYFASPWYWRIAEIVSVLTVIILLAAVWRSKRKVSAKERGL